MKFAAFELLENLLIKIKYRTNNKVEEEMSNETYFVVENIGGAWLWTTWYNAKLAVSKMWLQ